ncbi:MAG: 16S rRNA (uracil(1498)-N(3))-methyltransferase [Methylococcales bacterium]|nr:16S rRNA (uracil(1498)-N(3))-methyltransferase [Methylococcales bacterium]
MRISRLYVAEALQLKQKMTLQEDNAHYIRSVLRLKKNQQVTLFNGLGGEYLCVLEEVSRKRVTACIEEKVERSVESPLHITLGLGVSRGDRMDWAVQKSVELGVNQITPLVTERCVVKLKEDKRQQKQQHWKHIVQHATEQSGRTLLPELMDIQTMQDWMPQQQGLTIFLDPYAKQSLATLTPVNGKVTLLIGPEGGFSPQEREAIIAAQFTPVQLGQRILRTETASLAALAAVQMLWGDFS